MIHHLLLAAEGAFTAELAQENFTFEVQKYSAQEYGAINARVLTYVSVHLSSILRSRATVWALILQIALQHHLEMLQRHGLLALVAV